MFKSRFVIVGRKQGDRSQVRGILRGDSSKEKD